MVKIGALLSPRRYRLNLWVVALAVVGSSLSANAQSTGGKLLPMQSIVDHFTTPGVMPAIDFPNITFEFDSAVLTSEGRRQVVEIGKALRSAELATARFRVEGHTDKIGDMPYNQALSLKRARTVATFLLGIFNINEDRLEVVGKGETEPLPGKKPTDPANRRVKLLKIS
jgi:outer membrane protein OmpA-like peptidoglycan-associated protein